LADKTSAYRVIGIESIRSGLVLTQTAVTYMIGDASLNTLGNFVPDSAHLMLDAETVNNFFVEDKAEIDCQIKTPGLKTIEFATRDMGATMMAELLGGSASNVTCYLAPITAQVVNEKCFTIITKAINGKKFTIQIPRASVSVGGDLRFGRSETGTLTVSAVVMQPYSAIAPYKMIAAA